MKEQKLSERLMSLFDKMAEAVPVENRSTAMVKHMQELQQCSRLAGNLEQQPDPIEQLIENIEHRIADIELSIKLEYARDVKEWEDSVEALNEAIDIIIHHRP